MNRGEVWEADLEPTQGAEIKKIRPCVIVNRDALAKLPLKIIVPITEWDSKFQITAWHVPIEPTAENGLTKKSSADTFQVRSISETRLLRRIGSLTDENMAAIAKGLKISLFLE